MRVDNRPPVSVFFDVEQCGMFSVSIKGLGVVIKFVLLKNVDIEGFCGPVFTSIAADVLLNFMPFLVRITLMSL